MTTDPDAIEAIAVQFMLIRRGNPDMGGADPSTDAAYQAAQLQHVARAVGLAVAAPVVAFLMFKLVCRARRG